MSFCEMIMLMTYDDRWHPTSRKNNFILSLVENIVYEDLSVVSGIYCKKLCTQAKWYAHSTFCEIESCCVRHCEWDKFVPIFSVNRDKNGNLQLSMSILFLYLLYLFWFVFFMCSLSLSLTHSLHAETEHSIYTIHIQLLFNDYVCSFVVSAAIYS